jgi:hypothetical protein
MSDATIRLDKLDAARRQLRTAITLWFTDGDPVAVHTLAFAAYEIIHVISKKRNPHRRDLLFDTLVIKDEYRRDWNAQIKRDANFFKHADRDPDLVIEFQPYLSQLFILYSIIGRLVCGERASDEESAFWWWFQIENPESLTEKGKKFFADTFPVEDVERAARRKTHASRPDYAPIARLSSSCGSLPLRLAMRPALHDVDRCLPRDAELLRDLAIRE